MEVPLPMSHERIESLSSLTSPVASEARDAQATSYPAKRVQGKWLPAAEETLPSTNPDDEAPNSQESHVSSSSKGNGVAKFASDSSSNLSNPSLPDSDGASPVNLTGPFSAKEDGQHLRERRRPLTPEVSTGDKADSQTTSQSTSPMSVDSLGLKHGSKRTASGSVKPSAGAYLQAYPDSRSWSTERTSKRISEVRKIRPYAPVWRKYSSLQ